MNTDTDLRRKLGRVLTRIFAPFDVYGILPPEYYTKEEAETTLTFDDAAAYAESLHGHINTKMKYHLDKEAERIDAAIDKNVEKQLEFLQSEEFIDKIVARILSKQLKL